MTETQTDWQAMAAADEAEEAEESDEIAQECM